ncbi:MAG: SCP2 sterol-binding domain-containing protein [Gaiellaceae bacterium]
MPRGGHRRPRARDRVARGRRCPQAPWSRPARCATLPGRSGTVARMAAKDFFDSLASRADPSKLEGMSNSYLFEIEDEGEWLVKVADGKLTVTEGGGEADATILASGETFDKIVAGDQNPTTAYMTGKLKIKGDLGAAMKLQKLF